MEEVNQIYSLSKRKDAEYDKIFNQILNDTEILTKSVSNSDKYKSVVSIEYLLLRLRLMLENESMQTKRINADEDTPVSLRPFFLKRDVYISQYLTKLQSIREDISVLQKVVYLTSFSNQLK